MQCKDRLLLLCLDSNGFNARLLNSHPDCLGVSRIALVTHNKGFDKLASQQLDLMPELDEFARSVLGTTARLHTNQASRSVDEVRQKLLAYELHAQYFSSVRVNPMELEHAFRNIDAYHGMLHVGLSCLPVRNLISSKFGTLMPSARRIHLLALRHPCGGSAHTIRKIKHAKPSVSVLVSKPQLGSVDVSA